MSQPQTKSSIPLYPPLPSPNKISPKTTLAVNAARQQPLILRTSSKSKQFKKSSVEKSIKEREIERQLKYAKPNKMESSFQVSLIQSSGNIASAFFVNQLEDSQDTIQKERGYSRQKSIRGNVKRQDTGDKGDVTKPFDVLSGVSVGGSHPKRHGTLDKNQQYYVYWKNKAHEYLESNMKLMEQNRKLVKQNEQLREDMSRLQQNEKRQSDKNTVNVQLNEKQVNEQIRKMNLHYITKIESMQRELKKKEIVIISYEAKVVQLNSKIAGDYQRIKIMNRMKDEIEQLQRELRSLKGEARSVNGNGYFGSERGKPTISESMSNRNLYYLQK